MCIVISLNEWYIKYLPTWWSKKTTIKKFHLVLKSGNVACSIKVNASCKSDSTPVEGDQNDSAAFAKNEFATWRKTQIEDKPSELLKG